MIQRKVKMKYENSPQPTWAFSPDGMLHLLEQGPIQEIYNLILFTIQQNFKINQSGYGSTNSKVLATKIWAMASDWKKIISGRKSAKQLITGLTIHRLTGREDVIQLLHEK